MQIIRYLAGASIAASLAGWCGIAMADVKWDLPTPYQATDHHIQNLELFAQDVAKATNNEFTIKVHINGSLFKQAEIKRAIQGSQVQIGEFVLSQYANEWPIFGVDNLPFLATSQEDAWKLYMVQKPLIEKKLDDQGMMLLYSIPWPPQGIYSNKELNSGEDFKGLKWRAYSPATSRVGELLHAQAMTIQAAELSQAMATGIINSYMSSATTGYATKTFEHLKYWYDVKAWLPKNAVVANKKAFAKLDKAQQTALLDAAAVAEKRGWEMALSKSVKDRDLLISNGMTVQEPSPQLSADLHKVGDTILQEWLNQAGPEGKALIDAYQKP